MIEVLILAAVSTSILTYFLTMFFKDFAARRGIVSIDLHKPNKPLIPTCGGIVLLFSLSIFLFSSFLLTFDLRMLYLTILTNFFGFLGLIDDFVEIKKWEKIFLTSFLAFLSLFVTNFSLEKTLFSFLFLVAVSNLFNTFAGLNGLEAGTSTIISFFMTLFCFFHGNFLLSIIFFGIMLNLLSFLFWNKYPSKIFLGNVGTYLMGGFFGTVTVYYDLFLQILPLLSLHTIDWILKIFTAGFFEFSEKSPTRVTNSGILKPGKDYLSLIRLILKVKPMPEEKIVLLIWLIGALIGILTFFFLIL